MTVRFYTGQLEQLSEDEVAGIAISAGKKRDGDAWEPAGVDLTAFKRNPVILRDHDPGRVIGTATAIGLTSDGSAIAIKIQFAPPGISAVADEARGLAKAGILRGISAGVDPIEVEPLRDGTRGVRVISSELLEVSLVAVPADADARITQRSFGSGPGAAMLRALPAISQHAMQTALGQVRRQHEQPTPYHLLSPREKFEFDRQRTMATWALGQAREREDYARRQAEHRALTDEKTH
jgi:HK97 family phage prohead protease